MTDSEKTIELVGIQEKLIQLRTLLASREWTELIAPNLQRFIGTDTMLLVSRDRGNISDDFLRGRLDAFTFFTKGLQDQADAWERTLLEADEAAAEAANGQPDGVGSPYSVPTTEEGE